MASHHAAGRPPPRLANSRKPCSAKRSTGRVAAMHMITTTNIGSVKMTPWLTYCSAAGQPLARVIATSSGTTQMPKMASTSPRKCMTSALKETGSFAPSERSRFLRCCA